MGYCHAPQESSPIFHTETTQYSLEYYRRDTGTYVPTAANAACAYFMNKGSHLPEYCVLVAFKMRQIRTERSHADKYTIQYRYRV